MAIQTHIRAPLLLLAAIATAAAKLTPEWRVVSAAKGVTTRARIDATSQLCAVHGEAVVEASFLVANADGEFDEKERQTFEQVVAEACQNTVQRAELSALVSDLQDQLQEDGMAARVTMVSNVIRNDEHALEVLRIAALMAYISGGVDDTERAVMVKLSGELGLPDGTVEQAGFVINAYGGGAGMFSPWLAANGGRYQDAAGTRALFGEAAGIEAMRFMGRLYWQDKVCPPFRRQISDSELFQERKVACMVAGTWSGKDIIRNTLGWDHFAKTAFPPGPQGTGQKTVTWGNMLVVTRRCDNVEAAWRYIQFVCSLEGNMMRSKILGYNGPRRDFYDTEQWQKAMAERPYLSNVKQICLVGDKLRHTEIIAVNHQVNPVIETLLLRFPEIEAGTGPHASVSAALKEAERNANGVFRRYNEQVARWLAAREQN